MTTESTTQPVEKKRGKRATKAYETRQALFSAASTIVGKFGYEGASITKITELAGIANGTFYNYFETRQDLFDQLLPTVGERLLEHIRQNVTRDSSGIERERQRMAASLEFFKENPSFMRVLNEAEVYAPKAFKQHITYFAAIFEDGLRKQMENGEIKTFGDDELKTIVYILMGARSYLMMQASHSQTEFDENIAHSFNATYAKLLQEGLFVSNTEPPKPEADSETILEADFVKSPLAL